LVPQPLPLKLPSETAGGFVHPHDIEKTAPIVVQPDELLTVMVWLPLGTAVNDAEVLYEPASSLYSRPDPTGLDTVTFALPAPSEQSTVCKGIAGDRG
jgi:hypothetical protein